VGRGKRWVRARFHFLHFREPTKETDAQHLSPITTSHCPLPTSLKRAGNGTRTRDPNLGKVVLYQLSYSRILDSEATHSWQPQAGCSLNDRRGRIPSYDAALRRGVQRSSVPRHGGEGNRTPDLLNAIQALSQLSYAPASVTASRARIRNSDTNFARRRTGTTKYSRGYSESQRIGTGEKFVGRYFAAPLVTSFTRSRKACGVPRSSTPRTCSSDCSDAVTRVHRRSIDADSNAPTRTGLTAT
jgi:hypothetical protein